LGGKLLLDGSGLGSAYTGSQQHGTVVVDKFCNVIDEHGGAVA